MTLFKLSYRNIKKSIKDYAIYFFTLILGISIFYVFNAIESQSAMMQLSNSKREILKLLLTMLSSVSIFVSIILGFLIIYASRFLMKRRHKEFGVYLTLGMSKRKISTILLIETILIGLLSLVFGLILGFFASQAMSIIVANLFEANMTKFEFVFSLSSCTKTILYFSIMYIIVMIFNTFSVSKCRLIDLLYSSRKNEQVKIKNPILCTLLFIVSIISLGYAYYLVIGNLSFLQGNVNYILIPIIIGIISTFVFFWSLSGLLLKIFTSFKSLYYKKLNSYILRQVSSQINTTVFSISMICLMLFLTIGILSAGLSIKDSINNSINNNVDIELGYISHESNINKDIFNNLYNSNNINPNDIFKDQVYYPLYEDDTITLKYTLGSSYKNTLKKNPRLLFDSSEDIMTISDYNKIAKLLDIPTYSIKDNEYMIIASFDPFIDIRNSALKNNTTLNIFNHSLKPAYNTCKYGYININDNNSNTGIIIVPDRIINKSNVHKYYMKGKYKTTNTDKIRKLDDMLTNESIEGIAFVSNTRLEILDSMVGLRAVVTFIAIYLGIIFLISSAAILALKQLSEAADNKHRYAILKKLGADNKMINRALFIQIGIFFLAPLLLAIVHSIAGIKFSQTVLQSLVANINYLSILSTALIIIFIYGGYFLITYWSSKNILKD